MRKVFPILTLILACTAWALSAPAQAAGPSATLSWTLASQYIDGTALAATDIQETLIQWRRPGSTTVVGSAHVAAPAVTTVVNGLVCGNFDFTAETVMKTTALSSSETPSVAYNTGVVCTANPPGGLGVK